MKNALRVIFIAFIGLLMVSSAHDELNFGLPMDMSVVTRTGVTREIPSRVYPIGLRTISRKLHPHLYFAAPKGERVGAVENGKVITSKYHNYFGNYVEVAHNDSVVTRYLHLSELYVTEGQVVNKGQVLGAVGFTGLACVSHLKLYIAVNHKIVDPCIFFPDIELSNKFEK